MLPWRNQTAPPTPDARYHHHHHHHHLVVCLLRLRAAMQADHSLKVDVHMYLTPCFACAVDDLSCELAPMYHPRRAMLAFVSCKIRLQVLSKL